jgi:hypothetical protein
LHEADEQPMQDGVVLILVRDILGGGLLAALAEGGDLRPVFPLANERAESALERVRPSRVLLECFHPAARSDQFFTMATSFGSRVILFAPAAPWEDCEQTARTRNVSAFVHPGAGDSLASLIAAALAE